MTVARSKAIARTCWRCKEPTGGPVCSSCGTIQPPVPGMDHFALLGIPRAFFFENTVLEQAYRTRSRRVHPDRFTRKSAVERRMSLQWTAALNEARRVLRDPIRRACYLATGQSEIPEQGGPSMDPAFLEQIFELQMSAMAEPDAARETATQLRDAEWADIEAAMRSWEAGSGSLDGLDSRVARLKYIEKIIALTASSD